MRFFAVFDAPQTLRDVKGPGAIAIGAGDGFQAARNEASRPAFHRSLASRSSFGVVGRISDPLILPVISSCSRDL
jgi:hypothetical protein